MTDSSDGEGESDTNLQEDVAETIIQRKAICGPIYGKHNELAIKKLPVRSLFTYSNHLYRQNRLIHQLGSLYRIL